VFSASPCRRILELGREGWAVERLCGVGDKTSIFHRSALASIPQLNLPHSLQDTHD